MTERRAQKPPAAAAPEGADVTPVPAVPIAASITPNFLICLETGTRQVLLRRHLREHLDMTPGDYRRKWGLPDEYPMAAETYLSQRARYLHLVREKDS